VYNSFYTLLFEILCALFLHEMMPLISYVVGLGTSTKIGNEVQGKGKASLSYTKRHAQKHAPAQNAQRISLKC
jgi:hypothetical protein